MKGIFLVSLNSKKLEDFLNRNLSLDIDKELKQLDLFVFDGYETLNGIFFNSRNVKEQDDIMENTISRVLENIVNKDLKKRKFLRLSQLQLELCPYVRAVHNEYFTNASFKRHCKSQIFQNLQPKLRDVSILNHKSNLIELISPFLLAEIALYLYVFDKAEYEKIYGLEAEMNIIAEIKNGKYKSFELFLNKKTEYEKVFF